MIAAIAQWSATHDAQPHEDYARGFWNPRFAENELPSDPVAEDITEDSFMDANAGRSPLATISFDRATSKLHDGLRLRKTTDQLELAGVEIVRIGVMKVSEPWMQIAIRESSLVLGGDRSHLDKLFRESSPIHPGTIGHNFIESESESEIISRTLVIIRHRRCCYLRECDI
jgi:hypothetical protein